MSDDLLFIATFFSQLIDCCFFFFFPQGVAGESSTRDLVGFDAMVMEYKP